jgi:hypothetical protein
MNKAQIDTLINPAPHPLKARIAAAGLTLFQLKALTDGPEESMISRILNGQRPMPEGLEQRIVSALKMVS